MGSEKPCKQSASQRPTKVWYNLKYELCCRSMWHSVINLTVLNCKVPHEKSSSALFFTTAKESESSEPEAA